MAYLSDQDLEAEAIQLRNMMGLPLEVPLTSHDLIRGMERAFPGIRLLAVPDEEMTRTAAEADTRQNKIKFRQTAYNQLMRNSAWALEVLERF
jgi:hypothetical protein